MFQRFNTDTLSSRIVKNLLSTTDIPLLHVASDYEQILKGCIYLFREFIIECVETGFLEINPEDKLYPGEDIYPSESQYPTTGNAVAKFKVIARYNSNDKANTYRYLSSRNYYDSETHEHLGKYLRYLKARKIIDLMPYYNCYSDASVDSLHIAVGNAFSSSESESTTETSDLILSPTSEYKVISVPILFNTSYTIALQSDYPVVFRPVMMNSNGLVRVPSSLSDLASGDEALKGLEYFSNCDRLKDGKLTMSSMQFKHPIRYHLQNENTHLFEREHSLRLLIQLPAFIETSIVILEGDYTNINTGSVTADQSTGVINSTVPPSATAFPLSLLSMNTKESYAFSDRLVEYLLLNVVDGREELSGNIYQVQNVMKKLDPLFEHHLISHPLDRGVWTEELTQSIFNMLLNEQKNGMYLRDMDGYVNRDVEKLLYRKGLTLDGTIS